MYSTTSPKYACLYGVDEFALPPAGLTSGYVILCLNLVGVAYAIDRVSDYAAGAAHCSLMGQALKPGFDAHVAVVDPNIGYEAAADPDVGGQYVELVVEQESQILPIAVVRFDRR